MKGFQRIRWRKILLDELGIKWLAIEAAQTAKQPQNILIPQLPPGSLHQFTLVTPVSWILGAGVC